MRHYFELDKKTVTNDSSNSNVIFFVIAFDVDVDFEFDFFIRYIITIRLLLFLLFNC